LFDKVQSTAWELYYALIIGFILSVIVFVGSWYMTLVDFKKQCIDARRGIFSFDRNKIKLADASNWGGFAVANGILSHYYFTFIFALVAFLFTWSASRLLIMYAIVELTYIWVPIVVAAVVNILIKKIFVYKLITSQKGPAGDRILLRRWFHIYDLWMFFIRLGTGAIAGVVRFLLAIAVALITLPRTNTSPMPAWIERYTELDSGSKSFSAVIKL
jgi:hypothetical protein